jgi:hypothetical protein
MGQRQGSGSPLGAALMTMRNDHIEPATRQLIEDIVSRHQNGYEIEPCYIRAEVDRDDTPYIAVGLRYKLSAKPVESRHTIELMGAISDGLLNAGEERFPNVENYFDDKQQIKGMPRAR